MFSDLGVRDLGVQGSRFRAWKFGSGFGFRDLGVQSLAVWGLRI